MDGHGASPTGTYAAPGRGSERSARKDDQNERRHDQAHPSHGHDILGTTDAFTLRLIAIVSEEGHYTSNGSSKSEDDSEDDAPGDHRSVGGKPPSHVSLCQK